MVDREHCVIGQTIGIAGFVTIGSEWRRVRVEPIDSSVLRAYPDSVFAILEQRTSDVILAQALRIVRMMLVAKQPFALSIQLQKTPAVGGEPHRPASILEDRLHPRQSILIELAGAEGINRQQARRRVKGSQTFAGNERDPENT